MAEGDDGPRPKDQQSLNFEERREWLCQPPVRKLLVSLARKRLGLREGAEDLVQDFYKAKLDPVARAYDHRLDPALAITAFINFGKSKLGRKAQPTTASADDPDCQLAAQRTWAHEYAIHARDGRHDPDLLSRAMRRLPDEARIRLKLFYEDGLSHAEISQREGRSEAAIKIGLHRARAVLRDMYLEEALTFSGSDLPDGRGLLTALASSLSRPASPRGLLSGLLSPSVQARLRTTEPEEASTPEMLHDVMRGLNALILSEDLSERPPLAALVELGEETFGLSGPRLIILRNRQILEKVFSPLIRRFELARVV